MPCYEGRDRADDEADYRNAHKYKELSHYLQAIICALLNELEQRGIVENVCATASRHGLVNIMDYFEQHKRSDRARLANVLHKFSVDEQVILKDLLNNKITNDP